MEKYSNKRAVYRQSGRFARIPPINAMAPRKCANCADEWYPFEGDKVCPRCGSLDTHEIHDGPIADGASEQA